MLKKHLANFINSLLISNSLHHYKHSLSAKQTVEKRNLCLDRVEEAKKYIRIHTYMVIYTHTSTLGRKRIFPLEKALLFNLVYKARFGLSVASEVCALETVMSEWVLLLFTMDSKTRFRFLDFSMSALTLEGLGHVLRWILQNGFRFWPWC